MLFVFFSGRPPWYDCQGQIAEAFVIGEPCTVSVCVGYYA